MTALWERLRRVVMVRILGVDDTPHRIAWGVFWGGLIAMTPTVGFQIMMYVTVASLVRANKVSGIPLLFISNPLTVPPLYYFSWRVGYVLLHFRGTRDGQGEAFIKQRIRAITRSGSFWEELATAEFWSRLGGILWDMGAELWVGSLFLGLVLGGVSYLVARVAVSRYRRVLHR